MIELKINVPQIREFLNEVVQTPQKIFELMRADVRASMSRYLNQMMESEFTLFLGRGPYERSVKGSRPNHRNGSYSRSFTIKGIGGEEWGQADVFDLFNLLLRFVNNVCLTPSYLCLTPSY